MILSTIGRSNNSGVMVTACALRRTLFPPHINIKAAPPALFYEEDREKKHGHADSCPRKVIIGYICSHPVTSVSKCAKLCILVFPERFINCLVTVCSNVFWFFLTPVYCLRWWTLIRRHNYEHRHWRNNNKTLFDEPKVQVSNSGPGVTAITHLRIRIYSVFSSWLGESDGLRAGKTFTQGASFPTAAVTSAIIMVTKHKSWKRRIAVLLTLVSDSVLWCLWSGFVLLLDPGQGSGSSSLCALIGAGARLHLVNRLPCWRLGAKKYSIRFIRDGVKN